jgi:hypothetical protein
MKMTEITIIEKIQNAPEISLELLENLNASELYKDALPHVVKKIEENYGLLVFDVNTKKGREDIKSTAYQVSRSKTALIKLADNLVADWVEETKAVKVKKADMETKLDALRDKIRKPVDDWEAAEELAKQKAEQDEKDRIAKELLDKQAAELEALRAEKVETITIRKEPEIHQVEITVEVPQESKPEHWLDEKTAIVEGKDYGLNNVTASNVVIPRYSQEHLISLIREMKNVMPVLEWQLLDDAVQQSILEVLNEK